MAEHAGLGRRIGTVALWPVGMGLASWRYLWRTSPMHRFDEDGGPQDAEPALDDGVLDERVQRPEDGAGPFYRRRYSVRIEGSTLAPEQLMALITESPNRAAPVEVAVFRKTRGEEGSLATGDEYLVRMPGPWDGPVRVVARSATMFRFATLRGHLEAGQIEFRVRRDGEALRFEIESWARNRDRLSTFLYDRVGVAQEMQFHMWMHFCERVGKLAGGRVRGGVEVHTRRLDEVPRA